MSFSPDAMAVGAVRRWAALYTLGLPQAIRDARRQELACDLWEQQRIGELTAERPPLTAFHVLARAVMGMAADISWRAEIGRAANAKEKRAMEYSLLSRLIFFAATAIALVPTAMGMSVIAGAGDVSPGGRAIWPPLVMLSGMFMATGLMLSRGSPRLGLGLVAVGAIGISLLWFWVFFITVPIGLGLIWLSHRRGKGLDLSHGSGGA